MANLYLAGTVPVKYSPEQYRSLELWYDFLDDTYPVLREYEFSNIPEESEFFAVFVEYRKHPYIEYVLRNVMHFLGPKWGLQIFVWPRNRAFMENIVREWRHVHVIELPEKIPGVVPYDQTIRSTELWSQVKGEYQLFFDIYSLLCRSGIEDFLRYDYVAAPWLPKFSVSPKCRMGSGGLSLRRKTAMMEICGTGNADPKLIGREDVFFAVHLHLNPDRYRLPTLDTAMNFAVECVYHPKPLGVHMPWVCLPAKQIQSLLDTISYTP